MSSSNTSTLTYIGQQITVYVGFITVITGVLGNLFNIIVFLSLKTFRESTSGFYLIVISFVNIGQLLFGLISRIMIYGFLIDWNAMSIVFCKMRLSIATICSLISYTCLCLATIDQYLATSIHPRWQQWSNMRTAYYLTIIFSLFWILHTIPYSVFLIHVTSLATGAVTCIITNNTLLQYRNYFASLFLSGYIPDFITLLFGMLAYRNINQIAYRTIPLVRRELDKQLTVMVLVQVIINLITNIPTVTISAVVFATSNIKNAAISDIIQFLSTVTTIIFYTYYASSFYIYMCVSERFRRQFIYVLFEVHLQRWRQRLTVNNQIAPA
ncbi:unnamed protein product [Adineta steineri]|uniref:G-protein coupled receptors family 1 profile domain-containing protein n=1 Tax=Adineta steineri TaxID=433720 RepID=A0A815T293_9BILA|nr:unnamed protein product [Adineta steineri]